MPEDRIIDGLTRMGEVLENVIELHRDLKRKKESKER